MEKLSIEEKAKRYDEAIEIARKIKNGEPINVPDGTLISDVIFPELKESESERIRKFLIDYFSCIKSTLDDDGIWKGFQIDDIIAYIERQEAQKPVWSEYDEHKVKDIIYYLNEAKKQYASTIELEGCIHWLWSLLQRMG